ncbi:MAG TPA: molybdate ABC transporter substrate-binding protein [Gammaproteobacteria bacterium]|nr:molybdate ABC transporter substrate-binding protein [Gammaproteobacteria bacterium]
MKVAPLMLALAAVAILPSGLAAAAGIRIAVASNFAPTLHDIAARFHAHHGDEVTLVTGSTGKLYAQIVNGAPVDAFFAADSERPQRLEAQRLARAGSRFTYALGRLVLWSPREGLVDAAGAVLQRGNFHHLAIANPRLAPYGRAARQLLEQLGLWDKLAPRLIRGENIGQAFQFVHGGHAELGLVAAAQLVRSRAGGSRWRPPSSLYAPIRQQAVQLTDSPATRDFLAFTRGEEARRLIAEQGYGLP